jgi:hypothetical protein
LRERAIITIVTMPMDLLVALACDALSAAEVDEGPPHLSDGAVLVFCDCVQETGWRDWRVMHHMGLGPTDLKTHDRRWDNWWSEQMVHPSFGWLRGCATVLLFEDWTKDRWPIERIVAQHYAASYVMMNGRLISDDASVRVNHPRGQPVMSIARGYIGQEPDPPIEISVTQMAPTGGALPDDLMYPDLVSQPVTLEVSTERRPLRARGFIHERTVDHDGTVGFEFRGVPDEPVGFARNDAVPGTYLEINYDAQGARAARDREIDAVRSSERAPARRRRR